MTETEPIISEPEEAKDSSNPQPKLQSQNEEVQCEDVDELDRQIMKNLKTDELPSVEQHVDEKDRQMSNIRDEVAITSSPPKRMKMDNDDSSEPNSTCKTDSSDTNSTCKTDSPRTITTFSPDSEAENTSCRTDSIETIGTCNMETEEMEETDVVKKELCPLPDNEVTNTFNLTKRESSYARFLSRDPEQSRIENSNLTFSNTSDEKSQIDNSNLTVQNRSSEQNSFAMQDVTLSSVTSTESQSESKAQRLNEVSNVASQSAESGAPKSGPSKRTAPKMSRLEAEAAKVVRRLTGNGVPTSSSSQHKSKHAEKKKVSKNNIREISVFEYLIEKQQLTPEVDDPNVHGRFVLPEVDLIKGQITIGFMQDTLHLKIR